MVERGGEIALDADVACLSSILLLLLSMESSIRLKSPVMMSGFGRSFSGDSHIPFSWFQNSRFSCMLFGAYIASMVSVSVSCHWFVIRSALPRIIVLALTISKISSVFFCLLTTLKINKAKIKADFSKTF